MIKPKVKVNDRVYAFDLIAITIFYKTGDLSIKSRSKNEKKM